MDLNDHKSSVPVEPSRSTAALRKKSKDKMNRNKDGIEQAELDRYGIETVPANMFLWGGYRYSNARDALAAAKRDARP